MSEPQERLLIALLRNRAELEEPDARIPDDEPGEVRKTPGEMRSLTALLRRASAALSSLEAELQQWKERYAVVNEDAEQWAKEEAKELRLRKAAEAELNELRAVICPTKDQPAKFYLLLAQTHREDAELLDDIGHDANTSIREGIQAIRAERDHYKAALSELLDGARQYYAEADATANWETRMGEWLDRAERALAPEEPAK